MERAIYAIYEHGVFRPVPRQRLAITEGQRVRITVDDEGDPEALRLAASVSDGLSGSEITDIEGIAWPYGRPT
jgi:predicted DNA-binding antitoxin AbrB/MazE fold protein